MQEAAKSMARQLEEMIRFSIIDKGIIASSPTRDSQIKNITIIPKAPQKSPMIVALFHLYTLPPHSKARRNMIEAGAKSTKPIKSRDLAVELKVDLPVVLVEWLGMWIMKRKIATRPPAGRLR